ncbi:hypothetical protein [Streptomyces cellulosae]|uniref:Gram-positive cocci surface proteins LPxTG domain-containing protein n=1 Tax=Streptomyces cellulosae TaxID=1968 RepID=A0ABW7Y498_STRCE
MASEPAPDDEGTVGGDEEADGDLDGQPDDDATAVPEEPRETVLVPSAPPQGATRTAGRSAESRLEILPLGGGLILVGLGLGLAFLALRLRRAS